MRRHISDLAYSGPMIAVAFIAGPTGSILQPLYAKYFGLSLTAIAMVLVAGRIVDAVTDPLIGYVSDRLTHRYGSPALLLYLGVALLGVCGYFLFNPLGYNPSETDFSVGVLYFGFWYIAYYIAQTLFEIPHTAWGGEIALSSEHKTRIYTYRAIFTAFGVLGFYFIPYVYGGGNREITPDTLSAATFIYFILAPLLLYFFYQFLGKEKAATYQYKAKRSSGFSFYSVYRAIVKNKPYRVLTAIHICTGFASAMYAAILFFFVDGYLGLGEHFALLFILSFGIGMSSLPVWYAIAAKWGRNHTWMLSLSVVAIGYASASTLEPGESSWIPLLVFSTLIKIGFSPFMPFLSSMLSDVSDYGSLKYKTEAASSYFAVFGFINKVIVAVSFSIAYAIIGFFGFDPTTSVQSPNAIVGLKIVFIWLPTCFLALAVVFLIKMPIDERRHNVIKRRLNQRADRISSNPS